MKTKHFLIYDPEEGYARRLALRLSQGDLDFRFRGFSSREKLLQAAEEEPAQVVLTDLSCMEPEEQDGWMEALESRSAEVVCFQPEALRADRNWSYVNKYRSASQIYREVMQEIRKKRELPSQELREGLLRIGVFSPVGGCGKTALSRALSRLLGEKERTLRICMETFSEQTGGTVGGDFADVAYYFRQERLTEEIWNRLREKDMTADYIGPPLNPEDLELLSGREMTEIWSVLGSFGYECLVIDAGSRLATQEAVFDFCDLIAAPEQMRESGKWEHFLRYVRGTGRSDWEKKLWFVSPDSDLPEAWWRESERRGLPKGW